MKAALRKSKWLLLAGAAALIAVAVGFGPSLLRGDSASEEKAAPVEPAIREVAVTCAPATPRPLERAIEVVGTLEGHEEVNLGAKVEGRVARLYHDVGDEVPAGHPLVDIDDTDYRLAVVEAQRGLELELARLGLTEFPANGTIDYKRVPSVMRAKNLEDNARQVFDRARRLGRSISTEEMEKAQTESSVALAAREHAELEARAILATAKLKQAQLETAKQKLIDTRVRAPLLSPGRLPAGVSDPRAIRYVVAARKVAEGEMIRAMPAVTLFRLVIDNPLKLVATIPERFLAEVKLGQKVALAVESYPGETFHGTVARLNPTVDRGSRTFTVEVTVPNDARQLRPGSFVKARVLTRQADRALTVPEEAVVRFAGVVKVFVVEDGKARAVPVRTGEVVPVRSGEQARRWVEVVGSLRPGASVVTSGQSQLADETRVRVR
jgi:multidrug efflux pump subunit AcrA (membrane-fusion protein)